jgi:hypothetical protein
MDPTDRFLYHERLSSNKTLALFAALTLTFCGLAFWRLTALPHDWLVTILLILTVVFLFYTINYRTLIINLTSDALTLKFGVFRWRMPLENIADCQIDNPPPLMRYGGAGIHFYTLNKRYRASFNFLEYPRVVVAFKRKAGMVRDLSFSTRQPDELIRIIEEASELPDRQNYS